MINNRRYLGYFALEAMFLVMLLMTSMTGIYYFLNQLYQTTNTLQMVSTELIDVQNHFELLVSGHDTSHPKLTLTIISPGYHFAKYQLNDTLTIELITQYHD